MKLKLEKKDGIDVVVYADGPPGWSRPASADEVVLWTRIVELEQALHETIETLDMAWLAHNRLPLVTEEMKVNRAGFLKRMRSLMGSVNK